MVWKPADGKHDDKSGAHDHNSVAASTSVRSLCLRITAKCRPFHIDDDKSVANTNYDERNQEHDEEVEVEKRSESWSS